MTAAITKRAERRFWSRVKKRPTGCWEWTGGVTSSKHPQVWIDKTLRQAVTVAALLTGAPLPEPGEKWAHFCRLGPRCVNPAHKIRGSESVVRQLAVARGVRFGGGGDQHPRYERRATAIRRARAGGATYREIESRFDLSQNAIWRILSGRRFRKLQT